MKLPINYNQLSRLQIREVREEYIKKQNGLCYFCHSPLDKQPFKDRVIHDNLFPTGFFNNPVHLHHSHDTGLTLGAVHCYCNAVLWEYFGE